MKMLSDDESLFTNPGFLDISFVPGIVKYREEQQSYMAQCVKPLVLGRNGKNIMISGSPGIGKTLCTKFIMREASKEYQNLFTFYVNCWKRDTSHKISTSISKDLEILFAEKKSSDELMDSIIKKMNNFSGTVIAFDEIDRMKDYDFLYRILEDLNFKTIFMITNKKEWILNLDERISSRMSPEEILFKAYNYEETEGILRERIKNAFVKNVWEEGAFEIIVENTNEKKDIRFGLALLKESGEIAESRASRKIEIDDAKKALERLK